MFCPACGASVVDGVRFCARCGAQVAAANPQFASYSPAVPVYVPQPRVQRHIQALGIVWFIFAVYRLVKGILALTFFRVASSGHLPWMNFGVWGPFGSMWMAKLYPVIAIATILAAGLSFATAYGLTTRQPWGRVLAIIVAVLSLIKFPFGTLIGIYTLWVLAPSESGLEYDAMSVRS